MATILLLRQKFNNKLVTPNKVQWRLAQKAIGIIDRDTLITEAASHSRLSESELNSALNALCDSAAMFLSIGHGVQLGNLGTLSLSISSKAVDTEEECTADTIRGNVGVNLRAIGRLAKAIAEFKFRVAGISTEASTDTNPTTEPDEDSIEEPETTLYTLTWKHQDEVQKTEQLAENATITAPDAPDGYHWVDVPTRMPAHALTIESAQDTNEPPVLS